uniref:PDZ domain-containing protein n=1 Tax=Periophthalmus magnuspinnatus TaxID=409849 RepID=A0A3B4A1K7_9GOBI
YIRSPLKPITVTSQQVILSMPTSNQGWPEEFGFQLGGGGPSYILSVEEGSSAHLAGLQPGDQVLEIEGHNVSTLPPQAVIAIAQTDRESERECVKMTKTQSFLQKYTQHLFVTHSSLSASSCLWPICPSLETD